MQTDRTMWIQLTEKQCLKFPTLFQTFCLKGINMSVESKPCLLLYPVINNKLMEVFNNATEE